jgi:hypothetical protein
MTEAQAKAIETIIKGLPKGSEFAYRKAISSEPPTEILPGERSDVSWITTDNIDREGDVILSRGMNDSQFKINPIVTLEHNYTVPPVGKSIWRKIIKQGPIAGIKAKTIYPNKPPEWNGDWPSDIAFSLIKAGLLQGKSIGALPTKIHFPTNKELDVYGKSCKLIVDEWMLIEYACTLLPVQQNAVVEAVSKGAVKLTDELAKALGLDPVRPSPSPAAVTTTDPLPTVSRFTPLEEIEKSISRRIGNINVQQIAEAAAQEAIDRIRGRV